MNEQAKNLQVAAEEARAHFSDPVMKKLCDAIANFASGGEASQAPTTSPAPSAKPSKSSRRRSK